MNEHIFNKQNVKNALQKILECESLELENLDKLTNLFIKFVQKDRLKQTHNNVELNNIVKNTWG